MCSRDIASGGYDSGGGAGKCKSSRECFKNLFLSISSENRRVFRNGAGLVTPLFIRFDENRRPKKGRPRDGSVTKYKKTPARRASEKPCCGGSSYIARFSWIGCEPNRFMSVSPEPENHTHYHEGDGACPQLPILSMK
jgi:hypothetical protein